MNGLDATNATRYMAREGDSLQSIALAVWGDASLWYVLADRNGLAGDAQLAAGQILVIPANVASARNAHDTFRPLRPHPGLWRPQPTTQPKPPKAEQNRCWMMGLVAVARNKGG